MPIDHMRKESENLPSDCKVLLIVLHSILAPFSHQLGLALPIVGKHKAGKQNGFPLESSETELWMLERHATYIKCRWEK